MIRLLNDTLGWRDLLVGEGVDKCDELEGVIDAENCLRLAEEQIPVISQVLIASLQDRGFDSGSK